MGQKPQQTLFLNDEELGGWGMKEDGREVRWGRSPAFLQIPQKLIVMVQLLTKQALGSHRRPQASRGSG